MFNGGIFLLFGAFVVLIVVLGILGYLGEKKRREEFQAVCAQRGWTWVERDDRWVETFADQPFGLGHRRSATNVVTGAYDSRQFVSFDYRYHTTETSTDSEGHTTTREVSLDYSVVAVDSGAAFPDLSVTPEGFFSRMIGRLTNTDIELESEDFNRAFTVTCSDRKFASDVLHPRMMEFLLAHTEASFRFDRRYVLTVSAGRASLADIDAALALVDAVLDRVPEFVWRQARGQ
ncbi:MAG: DUF3137 domain-containing protein [Nocardioides sp.]